jgi:hypothetical protein
MYTPADLGVPCLALKDVIELLERGFAAQRQPFDIEVALWGLSYRFPTKTRDELRTTILAVLGDAATPPREPIKLSVITYLPKKRRPAVRQQVTWERKAG